MLAFPEGFLWGAASSGHQVEGNNDGCDWWDFEQQPGRIYDGSRSGNAAEWWSGRAEEDLTRAKEMGHTAHRMGIEWSRLEPEPGHFNAGAFDRYRQIFEHARELGLELLVTLNHFTLPRWVAARGSWLDSELPELFTNYARECALRFSPLVNRFITLNEPSVLAYMAYAGTRWPPALGSMPALITALGNMLRAHAGAYREIHEVTPGAEVGVVHNAPCFDPARPSNRKDRVVARAQDWAFTGALLHALQTGLLLPPLAQQPVRVADLRGALDFFGLNYYGRYQVRFSPKALGNLCGVHVQSPTVHTAWNDWGQVWPLGLERGLLRLKRLGVPLYVTENGIYDNEDEQRPGFLVDHLRAVRRAIDQGAPVQGYFHWALVDNFEWAEGWRTHFGLLQLDRETQQRTPRPSAEAYSRICRAGGIPLDI